MTTTVDRLIVEPGDTAVIDGMPDGLYHAHPALSYSGAKLLLPPSTPAHYRYDRDNPRPPKRAYDLGHAAHRIVLGVGAELVDIDADSYRTKAAQEDRDAAYDAGKTPLLPRERAAAQAMADAVRAHPLAGRLFSNGRPEVSLFWIDEQTGVPLRSRLDWLRDTQPGRVLIVPDLKTSHGSVHPDVLPRVVESYRYHLQHSMYENGITACGLAPDGVAFVLVFVEKEQPHAVNVVQLDQDAINTGRALNLRAIEIYRDCLQSGIWPAHPAEVHTIGLPRWAMRSEEDW